MSLKYGRSVLFDKPQQTIAGLQLQTIVHGFKERLNLNQRSCSNTRNKSPERLSLRQAKGIEALKAKLGPGGTSFHSMYRQYQRDGARLVETGQINPQRMKMFRDGAYRCFRSAAQRPKTKEDLMEYYYRLPQEQELPLPVAVQTISYNRVKTARRVTTEGQKRRKSVA